MLTVVGIIAVLVAVSIPVVNSSLKKAQVATDAANERAAKGAMMMESLLAEGTGGTSTMYYDNAAGKWTNTAPTPYGKCEIHKGCYLKGEMLESGEVRIVWEDKAGEKDTLCSGEPVAAEAEGVFTYEGDGCTFDDASKVLTISQDGANVTVRGNGKPTSNRIVVANGVNANITLKDVNIVTSEGAAFEIADNYTGNVTVTLVGNNILKSGSGCAGLQKAGADANMAGWLTIKGEEGGELTAIGGDGAAGIGGSAENTDAKNIEIQDCTVIATGGANAAGIGGGCHVYEDMTAYGGDLRGIIISNSNVKATGNGGGAGIGGGGGSSCGGIFWSESWRDSSGLDKYQSTITNSTVTAEGGASANTIQGIGAGERASTDGSITITNSTINKAKYD